MTAETVYLRELIAKSHRIVFFGGAGVSTESQIPDFRGSKGLYREGRADCYTPEEIISHSFFTAHPKEFFAFYFDKMVYPTAKPNAAHRALARLEEEGKLTAVVTQNIDGLHQMAGSRRVMELHGSVLRNTCTGCKASFSLSETIDQRDKDGIPHCGSCGAIIKPDVVLYEEALDGAIMDGAIREIARADLLIVGGTSLSVYPAAGLLRYFEGDNLVLINKTATSCDRAASLIIRESIGKVLSEACK